MNIDLHVHTKYSIDGSVSLPEYARYARKIGLSGFAVTDHNTNTGARQVASLAKQFPDLLIIPGMEVSSSQGHILAYNVTDPIPKKMSPRETCEFIENLGGIAVAAHPGRFKSGMTRSQVRKSSFSTIEVANGRSSIGLNKKAALLASDLHAGCTGGSDAHELSTFGCAYTIFEDATSSIDDILGLIQRKETDVYGTGTSIGSSFALSFKMAHKWIGRRGKSI